MYRFLMITFLISSCASNYNEPPDEKFNRRGFTAEEKHDETMKQNAKFNKKLEGVGIIEQSDSCKATIGDENSLASAMLQSLICAKKEKSNLVVNLQLNCKASNEINYKPHLDNFVVSWKTPLDKGKVRSNNEGIIRVVTKIKETSDVLTLESKFFKREIKLSQGPFEIWLDRFECNP